LGSRERCSSGWHSSGDWSQLCGSVVICDYIRAPDQDRIAAINFAEDAVKPGMTAFRHPDRPRLPAE
jgi:hypothetical protein